MRFAYANIYRKDLPMTTQMLDTIGIGPWVFSPVTGILTRDQEERRLENRAAALLEFLCQNPGQLVTHEDIIAHVWDGRFVSPNSVAVVISDIRRALGDEARNPTFVETLPKRGYRLIGDVSRPKTEFIPSETELMKNTVKPFRLMGALVSIALLALVIFINLKSRTSTPYITPVFVTAVVNDTDDAKYTALASAVSELLSVEVARHDNLLIGPRPEAEVIVSGKLILWDGHPAVALHATSKGEGRTIWSGMASGPETLLPRQVSAEISKMAKVEDLSE